MKIRFMYSLIGLTLVSMVAAGIAVSRGARSKSGTTPTAGQERPKTLREIATERDVEVDGVDGSQHLVHMTMDSVKQDASAIVFGRILESLSFFEESAAPIEQGENITTEYKVEVLRVLRDTTQETMPPQNQPGPEPLTTPLRIARNGGTVLVNGHRASVKIKGYEDLSPGKRYVFFLFWSPAYKAYVLSHGIYSVVMVNDDSSVEPLGSSKEIRSKLRNMKLADLFAQIK